VKRALGLALLAASCASAPPQPEPDAMPPAPAVEPARASEPAQVLVPHVQALGREDGLVWIDFAATGRRASDADLARALEPWVGRASEVGLARTQAGARTLAVVARLRELERLDLRGTPVGARELAALAPLTQLAWLNLAETRLDAAALDALIQLPALRRVHVWNAGLDAAAIERLRAARPELAVELERPAGAALEVEPEVALARRAPASPAAAPVNANCPVLGTPVDPAQTTLFEGRVIGFCCGSCRTRFLADPASFRSKLP